MKKLSLILLFIVVSCFPIHTYTMKTAQPRVITRTPSSPLIPIFISAGLIVGSFETFSALRNRSYNRQIKQKSIKPDEPRMAKSPAHISTTSATAVKPTCKIVEQFYNHVNGAFSISHLTTKRIEQTETYPRHDTSLFNSDIAMAKKILANVPTPSFNGPSLMCKLKLKCGLSLHRITEHIKNPSHAHSDRECTYRMILEGPDVTDSGLTENVVIPCFCDFLESEIQELREDAYLLKLVRNDFLENAWQFVQRRAQIPDSQISQRQIKYDAEIHTYQEAERRRTSELDDPKAKKSAFNKTMKCVRWGIYGSALCGLGVWGLVKLKKSSI